MEPKVQSLDSTYKSFKDLAAEMKEQGFVGATVLNIWGLTGYGTAGDRETFNITGTKIICPPTWNEQEPHYNENVAFSVCLNELGEDSDPWFDFQPFRAVTAVLYPMQIISPVIFHKITVRNKSTAAVEAGHHLQLWIIQDPQFIEQVNAMLGRMRA